MNQISEAAVESVPASTAVPATQEIVDVIEKLKEVRGLTYCTSWMSRRVRAYLFPPKAERRSFRLRWNPGIFEFSFTSRKSRP